MLLHVAVYFGCLLVATTLMALVPRAISARIWFGLRSRLLVVGPVTAAAVLVGTCATSTIAEDGLVTGLLTGSQYMPLGEM